MFSLSKVFAQSIYSTTFDIHTHARAVRRNEEDRKSIVLQSLQVVLDRYIRLKCLMAQGVLRQEFDMQAGTHAIAKLAE